MDIALAIVIDPAATLTLIGQRPTGGHLAGYWEFPGGKMEPGETAIDCAVREAMEETGAEVCPVTEWKSSTFHYQDRSVTLHPVLCHTDPAFEILEPWLWVRLSDLNSYRFPEANASILGLLWSLKRT